MLPKINKEVEITGLQLLSNKESSVYLGCAPTTLKQSRVTGLLFGMPAPAFLKMGYNVRYKLTTLDEWTSQFSETTPLVKTHKKGNI